VSRYQKGKANLDFTEARDSEWQWHQLGHNHASTPPLVFTGRMPFLPHNQQRQSPEGKSELLFTHCNKQVNNCPVGVVRLLLFLSCSQPSA